MRMAMAPVTLSEDSCHSPRALAWRSCARPKSWICSSSERRLSSSAGSVFGGSMRSSSSMASLSCLDATSSWPQVRAFVGTKVFA